VQDALGAEKREHIYLAEFRRIFENDYKRFAREEGSIRNEAEMFEKLMQAEHDLERMLNFPVMYTKTVGAIGGGFSSGKSTFINSFFTEKTVRLATAVKPSTAIPSFVVCENRAKITGYNSHGAPFPIEPDVYKSITHDSMKKIHLDLRVIIPYITVSCPMNKELFEHICLIDTPGYNPPSIGSSERDEETAAGSVAHAKFLVWLIGLDQTGGIPKSDLDFLKKDNLLFGKGGKEGRDLYIVLNNKSDVRIQSDIEKIIASCENTLKTAGLSYAGICAYNPVDSERKLYICRGMDFFEFLKSKNKPSANIDSICEPVRDVLDNYLFYLEGDADAAKAMRKKLSDLKVAVYDNLKKNYEEKVDDLFDGLKKQLDSGSVFEKHLTTLEAVRKKFNACFMGIAGEFNIKDWKPPQPVRRKHFCGKCGTKLEMFHKLCPRCGESTISGEVA
jgi:rubrerythrin